MKPSFLKSIRLTALLHFTAWSILLLLPVLISYTYGAGNFRSLGHFYTNATTYGIIFYINYLFLVPRLFFRERKVIYFISVLLVIATMYLLLYQIDAWMIGRMVKQAEISEGLKKIEEHRQGSRPSFRQFWMVNFMLNSVLVTGFSLGLAVLGKLNQNEKERKELEKEKLNSELAFLKNQISPHFFFNTLNNIYALIGMDPEAAQHAVLKLSKLMRYLLYESEQGKTLLSHEISFMKNYIDLMKLRLSPRVELKVRLPEEGTDFEFPPLLFIPFIENAFKHGISLRDNSFIHINMETGDNSLRFETVNSSGYSSQPDDGQSSGIGLENVRKRLALLFPEQYKLDIQQTNSGFTVLLEIKNISCST